MPSPTLLSLPPDLRLQIWSQLFSQPIHVGHVFASNPFDPGSFRSTLCEATITDKTNARLPNGQRRSTEDRHRLCNLHDPSRTLAQRLDVLLTCRIVYAEAAKLVFSAGDFVTSDRIILQRFLNRLAPWQLAALRTVTLLNIYHQFAWALPIRDNAVAKLASVRHLRLYVELVGNDYTDDDASGRSINSERNRDVRLLGVYGLKALELRTFEMWIAEREFRKRPTDIRTPENKAPWIERVKGILMRDIDTRIEPAPAMH